MAGPVPSRTFAQLVWVSITRIALVGTWFLATILIGRVMGVVGFGVYGYCQTIIKLITGCIGDPLDMAVMRQGPLLLRSHRSQALQLVRSAFWIRVVLGLLAVLIAMLLPAFLLRRVFFDRPDFILLAMLTAGGVLGDFLLRSVLGYFQIGEQFGKFLAVDSIWQGGRVVLVLALVLLHKLVPATAVGLYVIAPYIAFAAAWFLLPADVRGFAAPHREQLSDIVHYSKWLVFGLAMAAASERLDVLLLAHFKGNYEVGIYIAALAWAVVPDFLNGIVQTVLGPKIAPAHAAGRFNQLQKAYLRYAIPLGAVFAIIALPASGWVLRTFMSHDFAAGANVFRLLVLGTLFNTVFVPLPEALMNFVAPRRVTVCTALGLLWVAVGGTILIPMYGAIGAAGVMLGARILVGSIIMVQAHQIAAAHRHIEAVLLPNEIPTHSKEPV